MTDTSWLTDNWPLWLFFVFGPLVYEFWALATGRRTISRMVWTSSKKYPHMVAIALSVLSWLIIHFWITHGEWAVELPWTCVVVAIIWITYFTVRKRVPDGNA